MKNYFFKTTHPFSVMQALLQDVDPAFPSQQPPVNIRETESGYALEMPAPGFAKEDIKVTVQQQQLTISGTPKTEETEDAASFARREFQPRAFSRSFTLPKGVDASKIEVKSRDGLLMIFVPRPEEAPKPAVLEIAVQ